MSSSLAEQHEPTGSVLRTLQRLHTRGEWSLIGLFFFLGVIVIPGLNLLPADSAFHFPDYLIPLLGKFMCYALVALAVDLIWGYAGILSLGHGVFFALGGYAMGMYLMRAIGMEGVYRSELPDFMVFLDWKELPWYWYGFSNFGFALGMALFVPGILAYIFGFFAFRSRIRGVYFSIITQAMTYALMLLFFRNDTGFGGNNGLTDFKRLLGFSLQEPTTKLGLYVTSVVVLALAYLACRYLVTSKLGRVLMAVRDAESRLMFCGYNPYSYKLFLWTLSAMLCGLAGALYVPQVGIINPSEMQRPIPLRWRSGLRSGGGVPCPARCSVPFWSMVSKAGVRRRFPICGCIFSGRLFIVVTLLLPRGVAGLLRRRVESHAGETG